MHKEPTCPHARASDSTEKDLASISNYFTAEDLLQRLFLEIAIESHQASSTPWRDVTPKVKTITNKLNDVLKLLTILTES